MLTESLAFRFALAWLVDDSSSVLLVSSAVRDSSSVLLGSLVVGDSSTVLLGSSAAGDSLSVPKVSSVGRISETLLRVQICSLL